MAKDQPKKSKTRERVIESLILLFVAISVSLLVIQLAMNVAEQAGL